VSARAAEECWDWLRDEPYRLTGPAPKARIVVHRHVCPDGTPVECHSQYLMAVGNTLDRWRVYEWTIATSARPGSNEAPPDWSWLDARLCSQE
jgi:hypothetical protein